MYCIVHVVYGTHATEKTFAALDKLGQEPEDVGFETLYSGSGDVTPAYVGVELDTFDEATDVGLPVSGIKMQPTPAQIKQAQDMWNKLPPAIQKTLPPLGVYFVFATS